MVECFVFLRPLGLRLLINNKPSTGIVIAGYGNKELFPSLTEYKIIGVICGTLIYKFINREEVGIEESNVESTFVPFAQRDVVDTYTKGIDTQIQEVIFENINNIFNNFFEVIFGWKGCFLERSVGAGDASGGVGLRRTDPLGFLCLRPGRSS